MKKIFLFFAAVVMTAGVLSAQDINQAVLPGTAVASGCMHSLTRVQALQRGTLG